MRVLAAVDKFRETATAAQIASAIGHACWELGVDCVEVPIADATCAAVAVPRNLSTAASTRMLYRIGKLCVG
jgi:glycerate kinase